MSVQDILLQQAMQDNQNKPDPAVAMGVGGVAGGLMGALSGRGKTMRMAGGLTGLIAGGGLGAGLANMMKQSSPAGDMLARIQATEGNLSPMDKIQLEKILADAYNNMGV